MPHGARGVRGPWRGGKPWRRWKPTCPSSMQKAWEYGKKNLLISFDFESFLNYVNWLTVPIVYAFDTKYVLGQWH